MANCERCTNRSQRGQVVASRSVRSGEHDHTVCDPTARQTQPQGWKETIPPSLQHPELVLSRKSLSTQKHLGSDFSLRPASRTKMLF